MYVCIIGGWESTLGFGTTEDIAVKAAMKLWKRNCADDVKYWSRKQIDEYCGVVLEKVESGDAIENWM